MKKVLWIINNPLTKIAKNLGLGENTYNSWLEQTSSDMQKSESFEFCVAFPFNDNIQADIDSLTYYSFIAPYNKKTEYLLINRFKDIFLDCNPDVIHIWGTEFAHSYCAVCAAQQLGIDNKVVINIQGLVSQISKHYFDSLPINIIKKTTFRDFIKRNSIFQQKKDMEKRGKYEIKAIKLAKNIIGRTSWDKACTQIINPEIKYFYCNETLRKGFYDSKKWNEQECEKYSIFLSQAYYAIKGLHNVIEAMAILVKKYPDLKLYTTNDQLKSNLSFVGKLKKQTYLGYCEDLIDKYGLRDNIVFLGRLDEEKMINQYLKSNVFVLPSTIENSPNSLGEAMLLGVPCVASYVGGVPDMMSENEGFMYQSTAPYMLAYYIDKIFKNDYNKDMLKNAIAHANITHNQEINYNRLIEIYQEISCF